MKTTNLMFKTQNISKLKLMFLLLFVNKLVSTIKVNKIFKLTNEATSITHSSNFKSENRFVIDFSQSKSLNNENIYIRVESVNLNSIVSLWYSSKKTANNFHEVGTYSGNTMIVIGPGLFDGKLKEARSSKKIYFSIDSLEQDMPNDISNFTVIVEQTPKVLLEMPNDYSVFPDPSIGKMDFDWKLTKKNFENLKKLRFQLNIVSHRKNWKMSSLLKTETDTYMMNPVFVKTIGGILDSSTHSFCEDESCIFTMKTNLNGVKLFNLESYTIEEIEVLSVYHYEGYYDKTYEEETFSLYKLPFEEEIRNMDLTFSLISVTGNAQLYLNAKTIPTKPDSYDFSVKGQLSKKMTITWQELEEMKADGSDLYIGVRCLSAGEFLIKVDAHEPGFRGSLTSGVVESGFVQMGNITNYLYIFQIHETQDIEIDLNLVVVTGNVDLFALQCEDFDSCMIEEGDIEGERKGLSKVRNGANDKNITKKYKCEKQPNENISMCQFAIAVLGKEQGASHFELSLKDEMTHLLMIPGHSVSINLEPLQKKHLKFSFPKLNTENGKLYLSVESVWGEFSVYISKKYEYPNQNKREIMETFESPKNSLFNSMRIIEIDPKLFSSSNVQGIYYITVESFQETSINLKFYEKGENQISIHTLTAGKQLRGEINNLFETLYYSIPVSLTKGQAASVQVTLTPLKGHFVMLGSTNGELPYINKYQFFSEDNILKFSSVDARKPTSDYLIGITLHEFFDSNENPSKLFEEDPNDSFQYLISFSYTNKAIHLSPGIMTTYTINKNNMYLIQILDDFNDLLIFKSNIDGFNMKLCGHFSTTDDTDVKENKDNCKFISDYKQVSLYLKKADLVNECEIVKSLSKNHQKKCFFVFTITGIPDQIFRLGFTYNEKPFQIVKGELINGPYISDASGRINFVYHAEKNKEIGLFFNSKGTDLDIFTRLVRGDSSVDTFGLSFPSKNNYDITNISKSGYIQNIHYDQKMVQEFGNNPELLISIRPQEMSNRIDKDIFDPSNNFSLQTINDVIEINRTQTFSKNIESEKVQYFSFFNNGMKDDIKIYVMSNNSSEIEMMVSKGIKSRPPYTCSPIKTVSGISSINLELKKEDLKLYSHQKSSSMNGHYIIAVKSKTDTEISIYWNNKNDLNYIEITPNEPSRMRLDKDKKFYFTFYARDIDGGSNDELSVELRKNIRLYVKSNIRANIFLTKSTTGEMFIPSEETSIWKSSIARTGGITIIDILSKDSNYCVECLYIGFVEHDSDGEVTLVANIQHNKIPITLKNNIAFPEYLKSKEKILFRYTNLDDKNFNLITSMLFGNVDIYVGNDSDVSPTRNLLNFSMTKGLLIHDFTKINPKEFKLSGANEWFIMAINNNYQEAAFTLTVHKNESKSEIENGISKYIYLSSNEFVEYFYKPQDLETFFEVRVEVVRVFNPVDTIEVLTTLEEFISVHEIGLSKINIPLDPKSKSSHSNYVYFKYQIPKNTKKTFGINVHNTSISGLEIKIDVLNGSYKLLNLNEQIHGSVSSDNFVVYEAFGTENQLLFIELKKCIGDPKISYYQSDYSDLEFSNDKPMKKMEDSDSSVFYSRMNSKNGFIKIENSSSVFSSYMLNAFMESDMNVNPYFDLADEGDGSVRVDTEHKNIVINSIVPKNALNEDFRHKITYRAYFTLQEEVMKYVKNCGKYKIEKAFIKPNVIESVKEVLIVGKQNPNEMKAEKLRIEFPNLEKDKKYFGVVIAKIELFPNEEGYLTPTRSATIYYDEFKVLTSKYEVPYIRLIMTAVIIGLLVVAFIIVKGYILGELSRIEDMGQGMSVNLDDIEEESQIGLKELNKLEKIYYHEKTVKKMKESNSKSNNLEDESEETKMPSSQSLEEHCQEVELNESNMNNENTIEI